MATGAMANVLWGIETTFGTKATNIDIKLGYAVEITSMDVDNSPMVRRGLGNRNLQTVAWGEFKGSMGLKFDLVDPFIFRMCTGGYVKTGAGPYTYDFDEANTLPSFTICGFVDNIDGGTDTQRFFLGCVVTDWSLDVGVGNEPISMTLNVAFADVDDLAVTQAAVFPTNVAQTFAQAEWKKAGVAVSFTESVSIKCNQNSEMKTYLGSRFPKRARFGDREYEVSTVHYYQTPTSYFDEAWGAAGGPTEGGALVKDYVLTITPESGTTGDTYTFTFDNCSVTKISQPMKVGEDIMEDVTFVATALDLSVSSATASPTGWT